MTLSESEAWRIIEGMDWINMCHKSRGYEDMRKKFKKQYPVETAVAVRNFEAEKFKALYAAVDKHEAEHGHLGNYGGDDSFGDLLDHAIGLGEAFYNAVLADPSQLAKLDYVENFMYAVPYEDDYE
jgi:hypothetical protein